MDFNKLIARARAILFTPKSEWPVIAGESTTAADLYQGYIVLLAAIPAVFSFLKLSVIGVSLPFAGTIRVGVVSGLSNMVLGYVLGLVMLYVMALIVEALAPSFGGQKDRIQALKVVAYSYTASAIAGVGQVLPGLGLLLALAGGIYSIYLLYLGLPSTMKCPQDKAAGYTAVAIIIAIVLNVVIGMTVAAVSGVSSTVRGTSFSHQDEVSFDKDSPLGKLEEYGRKMEQAGKQMEAAQQSGDRQAQADALKAMVGAAVSGGQVEALDAERLASFVPESLAGLSRTEISAERNHAMGMQISAARASYGDDSGRAMYLEITDTGSAKGLLGMASWAAVGREQRTDDGYEKTYRSNGRLMHEQWSGSGGGYTVILGERFTVQLKSDAGSIDELKAAMDDIDLGGLEALKDEGVQAN